MSLERSTPKKKLDKSYAKVNIFLKVVGYKAGRHQIRSRFMRVESLHDLMWFDPGKGYDLEIVGEFDCRNEENTIYKAYKALLRHYPRKEIAQFTREHKVVVYKNIPAFAGLGGGSSNAATFLQMVNRELGLGLSPEALIEVGKDVGADVPFFLSGAESANVSGFGEVIEPFDEAVLEFDLFTPEEIRCSTPGVYQTFRRYFKERMEGNVPLANELWEMKSRDILQAYRPEILNDLFPAALKRYPELYGEQKEGYFFSGSGSAFFRPKVSK